MRYQETHTADNFHQGLKEGSIAWFNRTGDKYTLPDGWEQIPVKATVKGFDYPFIHTDKGAFHYSRFSKLDPQQQLL